MVVRPYPAYLCWRERMKLSSTVERSIFRRALSVRLYSLESAEACVKSIVKFGDLGASGVGWDDWYRAGVDGHDEGGGRQGVVNSG